MAGKADPVPEATTGEHRLPEGVFDCDLAIVGSGQVGSLLAVMLGKNGHRVTILERYPQFYLLSRAVTFCGETARKFAGIGFDPE